MTNNKPDDTLRDGRLKVSIWRNEGENGPYWSSVPARTYRDKNGKLQDTDGLVGTQNLQMAELLRKAYHKQNDFRREYYQSLGQENGQSRSRDGASGAFDEEAPPPYERQAGRSDESQSQQEAPRRHTRGRSYSR